MFVVNGNQGHTSKVAAICSVIDYLHCLLSADRLAMTSLYSMTCLHFTCHDFNNNLKAHHKQSKAIKQYTINVLTVLQNKRVEKAPIPSTSLHSSFDMGLRFLHTVCIICVPYNLICVNL